MSFKDDEPIPATQDVSGQKLGANIEGKIMVDVDNEVVLPQKESKLKVIVDLMGTGSSSDRSGVDLVTVLDVSLSMEGEKLQKMKTATQFVIRKLSPIDRLSVVTFAMDATRLCPLRPMTEQSKDDIEKLVNDLVVQSTTNITAGLEMGLQVLKDRNITSGRVVGIMLMSDGMSNRGGDLALVQVGKVPVYTFGFGPYQDPEVLKAIADNSMGGTFSNVQNQDNLNIAFSQCLAGLLTVVVQDLNLTVTQIESIIEKVWTGNYPQSRDKVAGSVTVSFGDLYEKEKRTVIVELFLNNNDSGIRVLQINYTYSTMGKLFDAPPIYITVFRTPTSAEPKKENLIVEESRVWTAGMMKEARILADNKKLEDAKDKIVVAQNKLEDVEVGSNPILEMTKSEMQELITFMKSQGIYETQGRPFALSSETSQDRQRFATRGDVETMRLFATPRMDKYLEQAKSFDEDPKKPPPTVDDDVKQELAVDPLSPIIGALKYYLRIAIQALKALDNVLNRSR